METELELRIEQLKLQQGISQDAVDVLLSVYDQATPKGRHVLTGARLHIDDTTDWTTPENGAEGFVVMKIDGIGSGF